uniref:Uncharacterized protein n=1 Tax=Arundo donax TaxID=35708 RepID=A0A0A8YJ34_ARUDO
MNLPHAGPAMEAPSARATAHLASEPPRSTQAARSSRRRHHHLLLLGLG